MFELDVAALHAFDKFIELFLHLSDQFLIVIDNFLKLRPIYLIFMRKLDYLTITAAFLLFLLGQTELKIVYVLL